MLSQIWKNKRFLGVYTKWVAKLGMDLGTEMAFWDIEINEKRSEGWIQPMFKDVKQAIQILTNRFGDKPSVIELGPGPRSRLTQGYDEDLFELKAIDPLADLYREHLGGRDFLIKGLGEEVDDMFKPESFHMAYASNVLDHVKNPLKCLYGMHRLVKPNGFIMIQGNVNEGTRTKWKGMHGYDLSIRNKTLVMRNRKGEEFSSKVYPPMSTFVWRLTVLDGNPWFSITFNRES